MVPAKTKPWTCCIGSWVSSEVYAVCSQWELAAHWWRWWQAQVLEAKSRVRQGTSSSRFLLQMVWFLLLMKCCLINLVHPSCKVHASMLKHLFTLDKKAFCCVSYNATVHLRWNAFAQFFNAARLTRIVYQLMHRWHSVCVLDMQQNIPLCNPVAVLHFDLTCCWSTTMHCFELGIALWSRFLLTNNNALLWVRQCPSCLFGRRQWSHVCSG